MGVGDYIAVASLVASLVAAVYAGLGYHRPKTVGKPSPSQFGGSLPEDAEALVAFLRAHEGHLVDLAVEVGLTAGGAAPDQKNSVVSYDMEDGSQEWHLEIELDEGATTRCDYRIVANAGSVPIERVTVFLMLRGSFIPQSNGSMYAGTNYGTLVHVSSVDRALLLS